MLYELLLAAIDASAVKVKGPAPLLLIQEEQGADMPPLPPPSPSQSQPPPPAPSSLTTSSASSLSSLDRNRGGGKGRGGRGGWSGGDERRRYVYMDGEGGRAIKISYDGNVVLILSHFIVLQDFGVEGVYQIVMLRFKQR